MSEHPVVQRAADLEVVDAVLCRLCDTPEQVESVKRILGVDAQEQQVAQAFAPEPPPPPPVGQDIDHLAHGRATVARYQALVDSYPDDDPIPLRERQRYLHLALRAVQRLEAQ